VSINELAGIGILAGILILSSIPVLFILREREKVYITRALAKVTRPILDPQPSMPVWLVLLDVSEPVVEEYRIMAQCSAYPVVYLYAAPEWMAEMRSKSWGASMISVSGELIQALSPQRLFLYENERVIRPIRLGRRSIRQVTGKNIGGASP